MRLEDQICFSLARATRSVSAHYRPLLGPVGLTQPQFMVMLVLWERKRLSIREIGAALQLDHGTLTPLLKRLEAAGLLARRRRADDERSVDVALTLAGAALQERVEHVPAAISDTLPLTVTELRQLRALLAKVRSAG